MGKKSSKQFTHREAITLTAKRNGTRFEPGWQRSMRKQKETELQNKATKVGQ
jgi:hypothetical protein